jgi:Mrp family chromosome partitioning ATPase
VDSIRQAVELARAGSREPLAEGPADPPTRIVQLNPAHLDSTRIVAHGAAGAQGRYYDMMRTQILQEMDENGWQFLTVTSATAGCGKTVTACNLALSIARLAERSVLLVDLDLQKPKVTEYLGIKANEGLLSVLVGEASLASVVVEASIGRSKLMVLPGEVCKSGTSEWMASQTMATLLQTIKREFRSRIVIFDMPPMLHGDDVISVLPQMEAVLLVAGVGNTSVSDIKECHKHLKTTPVVRVVVNRVTEATDAYYGYY